MPRKLLERNYRGPSVMPGSFRHPPFRMIERREFAERWTPEQVRGDGGTEGAALCIRSLFSREGGSPDWAPAFAGEQGRAG